MDDNKKQQEKIEKGLSTPSIHDTPKEDKPVEKPSATENNGNKSRKKDG